MKHKTKNIKHGAWSMKQKKNSSNAPCFKFHASCSRGGFTILYAVLISSLVLSIGLSIYRISIKQLTLSSAGRESQFAFYAADSGSECALYWDLQYSNVFPTSTNSAIFPGINCAGQTISGNVVEIIKDTRSATTTFTVPLLTPACAIVSVSKTDVIGDGLDIITKVESRGRNDCVNLTSPRRVERAIRVRY